MRYTLLRAGVLAVVGGLLWLAGLRGLLWAVVAVLVAAGASYVLLSGPRSAALASLDARRSVDQHVSGDDEAAEDARS